MGITSTELTLASVSTAEMIEKWRQLQEESKKASALGQEANKTRHTNIIQHDVYMQRTHVNNYSRTSAYGDYSRSAHVNSYTNSSHVNNYSRTHTDRTTPGAHTNSSHSDRYTAGTHTNYSRRVDVNYTSPGYYQYVVNSTTGADGYTYIPGSHSRYSYDTHGNYTGAGSHANTPARNSRAADRHSNSSTDTHSDTAARNSYSRTESTGSYTAYSHVNSYSEVGYENYDQTIPSYNQAFNHENYVPIKPAVYQLENEVITGDLELKLAAYDKNNDAAYVGDSEYEARSKAVKYEISIKRIEDPDGNAVTDDWHVLSTGSTSKNLSLDVLPYEDGIYQLKAVSYNDSITKHGYTELNGVKTYDATPLTKTYVSPITESDYVTFILQNHVVGAELTVVNASEFYNYIYGKETYQNRASQIKKYVEDAIYQNASAYGYPQEGLFLEIDLDDEDTDTYHVLKAQLVKDGTAVTGESEVIWQQGSHALGAHKDGYVFFPLTQMLSKGSLKDIKVKLTLYEYYSNGTQKYKEGTTFGLINNSNKSSFILISVDNDNPVITMTNPTGEKEISQIIDIHATDAGLGIEEVYYKVVKHGETPNSDYTTWSKAGGANASITLNQAGDYDVYVVAVDKAGNITELNKKNYQIAFFNVNFAPVPRVMKPNEEFTVGATILTDLNISKVQFSIDGSFGTAGYGAGTLESSLHFDATGYTEYVYTGKLKFKAATPIKSMQLVKVDITAPGQPIQTRTETIRIVDKYGEILDAGVAHTDGWEDNRNDYNSQVDPAEQRAANVFWNGEAFEIYAKIQFEDIDSVNEGCLLEKAELISKRDLPSGTEEDIFKPDGTRYGIDFTDYILTEEFLNPEHITTTAEGKAILYQSGLLYNEELAKIWGEGPVEIKFKLMFTDGTEMFVTIIIDNTVDYFMFHRVK